MGWCTVGFGAEQAGLGDEEVGRPLAQQTVLFVGLVHCHRVLDQSGVDDGSAAGINDQVERIGMHLEQTAAVTFRGTADRRNTWRCCIDIGPGRRIRGVHAGDRRLYRLLGGSLACSRTIVSLPCLVKQHAEEGQGHEQKKANVIHRKCLNPGSDDGAKGGSLTLMGQMRTAT